MTDQEAFESVCGVPKIVKALCIIPRLSDNLKSYEVINYIFLFCILYYELINCFILSAVTTSKRRITKRAIACIVPAARENELPCCFDDGKLTIACIVYLYIYMEEVQFHEKLQSRPRSLQVRFTSYIWAISSFLLLLSCCTRLLVAQNLVWPSCLPRPSQPDSARPKLPAPARVLTSRAHCSVMCAANNRWDVAPPSQLVALAPWLLRVSARWALVRVLYIFSNQLNSTKFARGEISLFR